MIQANARAEPRFRTGGVRPFAERLRPYSGMVSSGCHSAARPITKKAISGDDAQQRSVSECLLSSRPGRYGVTEDPARSRNTSYSVRGLAEHLGGMHGAADQQQQRKRPGTAAHHASPDGATQDDSRPRTEPADLDPDKLTCDSNPARQSHRPTGTSSSRVQLGLWEVGQSLVCTPMSHHFTFPSGHPT